HLRRVGPDAPVAPLVGVGQRAARNVTANAQVVKRRARSAQAANRVAQTVAKRHLRKGHAEQLIVTGESAYASVAAGARDTLGEFVMRQIFQKLREQRSSLVHATKQKGTPAE